MFSPYFSEKRKSRLTKTIIHSIIDGNVTARISEIYGNHSRTLSSPYQYDQRPPSAFAKLKRKRMERELYGETSDSGGLTKETMSNWSKDTLLDKESEKQ